MSIFASIPSPSIQVIPLGIFNVHIYALCILAGIIVAVLVTNYRLTKRGAERWVVLDLALWVILLGIAGARIYHVLSHTGDYFYPGANLLRVFYVWEGGIAIFGAFIGGAVGALIGCRLTGIRFFSFADALVPGLLLAQALGRFGNYFNHELFGLPTNLPWGLEIEMTNAAWPEGLPEGTLFHPTFLYEILWNVLGVVVILLLEKRVNLRWGKALGVYMMWYGIGRAFFESIRLDPSETFLGIRTNIWAAFVFIVLGIILLIVQSRRHPGSELSVYVNGAPKVKLKASDGDTTPSVSEGASAPVRKHKRTA